MASECGSMLQPISQMGQTQIGAAEDKQPEKFKTVNVNIGVLGHIDSGKTSLCRALSTVTSTASLDKHPQSQEPKCCCSEKVEEEVDGPTRPGAYFLFCLACGEAPRRQGLIRLYMLIRN